MLRTHLGPTTVASPWCAPAPSTRAAQTDVLLCPAPLLSAQLGPPGTLREAEIEKCALWGLLGRLCHWPRATGQSRGPSPSSTAFFQASPSCAPLAAP